MKNKVQAKSNTFWNTGGLKSKVSNLLRIMMSWTQKYSGLGSLILQYPNLVLPHFVNAGILEQDQR
jgi:hypothetical protein